MKKRSCTSASLLLQDVEGSLLPMAAAGLLLLLALIGGGVDLSRAYQTQSRLQYACDAGVLAGRRAVTNGGFTTAAASQAEQYFNANFDTGIEGASEVTFTPTSPDNGNTVQATASTSLPTLLMMVFGFDEIPLSTNCSASMAVGNSDIVMVLDTTGSMACTAAMTDSQCNTYIGNNGYHETAHGGSSRLNDLRNAMESFHDTVAGTAAGTNARIRFGFVPYSSAVNVGHLLSSSHLVDEMTIQTRVPVMRTVTVEDEDNVIGYNDPERTDTDSDYSSTTYGDWVRYDTRRYSKNQCSNGLPNDTAWANNGAASTETNTDIDQQHNRITTTTTTQPQKKTEYHCAKSGGDYYRERRNITRDRYSVVEDTETPIFATITEEQFDHFSYEAAEVDVSDFKSFQSVARPNGNNGADVSYTWDGCIEERATVSDASFSYSNLLGMSPSGALDLDIDYEPDSEATRWRPMWPGIAYYRTQWVSTRYGGYWDMSSSTKSLNGSRANAYCPYEAQLLEEMDESSFDSYVGNLRPTGATYHDLGMIWGARIASPDGIFSSTVTEEPANGGAVARHIVFMTDGQMAPNNNIYSTYGIEWHDRRVTDDGSSSQNSRHNSRFLAVCEAAKAKGIRVWVIAFSTSLSSSLEECASDESAYPAANANQLNAAFQEIARQVGELRITQ